MQDRIYKLCLSHERIAKAIKLTPREVIDAVYGSSIKNREKVEKYLDDYEYWLMEHRISMQLRKELE